MIRLIEDVGAPAAVAATDIVTMEVAPQWNEWASYIMAVGGYVGGFMNFGGPFVKNIGVASFDWAARSIYGRIRGGTTQRSVSSRRVSFNPKPAVNRSYQPEFESVTPHAF